MRVEPDYCIDCGAAIRVKPKTPGTCPYCGVHIATGRDTFHAIEDKEEPPPIREERRRNTRVWGALKLATGAILIAILVARGKPTAGPAIVAGILAAHGLFRILFSSGPNRDDDDYEKARKD